MKRLFYVLVVILFISLLPAAATGNQIFKSRFWSDNDPASGFPHVGSSDGSLHLYTIALFTDTISGMVFNDISADGVKDISDPGLQNWKIDLYQSSLHIDSATSDVNGNYFFGNLAPGTYTVSERVQSGWAQTVPSPPGTYTVTIADGQTITGKDFGNSQSSIVRGMVFYDRNANGALDGDEGGLTGWTINADASVHPQNSRTTVTQAGGLFVIDDAVTDTYTISLVVKPNWTQTYPPSTSYSLVVASVFDTSGFDFAAATVTDTMKYRTYPVDSLLIRRAITRRKANSKWCFSFTNNVTGVNGLHVVFSNVVDSITGKAPFTNESRLTSKEIEFSGAAISNGQTLQICGIGSRYGMRVKRWWWTFNGGIVSAKGGAVLPLTQTFIYTLPNTANIRNEVFLQYFIGGMTIGIPRPDAKTLYGWAVLPKSLSMYSSLIAGGFTHTGTPGGFVLYKGKPFVGRKVTLIPAYHNNRLVADLIALKFNIAASAITKTPAGLGELIYEEDGNPLSGLTLNQIAARADSNLTFWVGVPQSVFANLDSVIRKIDSAFVGPPDTFYVGNEIKFKGVKSVNEVPFLRPSPNAQPVIIRSRTEVMEEVPEMFELYQNYPNPFNPATTIQFELPKEAFVMLKVYNLLGQEVASLIDHEHLYEGVQEVEFEANNLSSGVYFYRIVAESIDEEGDAPTVFTTVKKMLLLR